MILIFNKVSSSGANAQIIHCSWDPLCYSAAVCKAVIKANSFENLKKANFLLYHNPIFVISFIWGLQYCCTLWKKTLKSLYCIRRYIQTYDTYSWCFFHCFFHCSVQGVQVFGLQNITTHVTTQLSWFAAYVTDYHCKCVLKKKTLRNKFY